MDGGGEDFSATVDDDRDGVVCITSTGIIQMTNKFINRFLGYQTGELEVTLGHGLGSQPSYPELGVLFSKAAPIHNAATTRIGSRDPGALSPLPPAGHERELHHATPFQSEAQLLLARLQGNWQASPLSISFSLFVSLFRFPSLSI